MERYDEAETSWLRFLGTPDHVIDFLKTEDGLHTGRGTRITVRTAVSMFAVFALFALSPGYRFASLAQQFPEIADAFLIWSSLDDPALLFVALLAGAACLSSLICLIAGIGWRKAAGDLNIFAEHVGEAPWWGRPHFIYLWRLPLTLIKMLLLRAVPRGLPPIQFLTRLTMARLVFWCTVTAVFAQLTLNQGDQAFQVLNTIGHFERDDLGMEARDGWPELVRLEVGCIGSDTSDPDLQLHFASGRTVNLDRMNARGMSKETALARVDDIRRTQAIPIVWKEPAQQQLFRENSAPLVRCVDGMLRSLPQDRREAFLAHLRG